MNGRLSDHARLAVVRRRSWGRMRRGGLLPKIAQLMSTWLGVFTGLPERETTRRERDSPAGLRALRLPQPHEARATNARIVGQDRQLQGRASPHMRQPLVQGCQ